MRLKSLKIIKQVVNLFPQEHVQQRVQRLRTSTSETVLKAATVIRKERRVSDPVSDKMCINFAPPKATELLVLGSLRAPSEGLVLTLWERYWSEDVVRVANKALEEES